MHGIGKTVFSGTRVEEFQVEVLGVMKNEGPKQSIILARLSGGPLADTGVLQGMSGSPVYIDGKLAGAVALTFAFSKEPIAGIRPIEDMLQLSDSLQNPPRITAPLLNPNGEQAAIKQEEPPLGQSKLIDIATPVSFAGFTGAAVERFAPLLRQLGLDPVQGVSGGGSPSNTMGNPADLKPGSMISVELLAGDMTVSAEGTVTYIDGQRLYAFGHRFLAVGSTDFPFALAQVLALLPDLSSSFKISQAGEWMGTITQDRSTAIAGRLGQRASLVPVTITVRDRGRDGAASGIEYRMQMVNDPVLSPLLLQMAVFSAIDATQRTLGASSFNLDGRIELQNSSAPIRIDNMYSGDMNTAVQASLGAVTPLSFVAQSGFDSLRLKNISLTVTAYNQRRQMKIDQVWTSAQEVRPGEDVELNVLLTGDNGVETVHKASYRVPIGAPLGPLYFTVTDAGAMNMAGYLQLAQAQARSASQVVSLLNQMRDNRRVYVRVWRPAPGYQVVGSDFPDPPPSLALILGQEQAGGVNPFAPRGSTVAELQMPASETVITGSKTVQVEVKE